MKRAVIDKIHPDVEISITGDTWKVRTVSTFSTQENTFTIGQYFETDYKGVISGTMKVGVIFTPYLWTDSKDIRGLDLQIAYIYVDRSKDTGTPDIGMM